MSRYHSYLNSAVRILSAYQGEEPFSLYSKNFFAADKKYGSGDRKTISHLCYCALRVSWLFKEESIENRVLKGLFLCSAQSNAVLAHLLPAWNEAVSLPVQAKLQMIAPHKNLRELFPFMDQLSEGIELEKFAGSLLVQPDLFLRIRPGHRSAVIAKLKQAAVPYDLADENALMLANSTKLDGLLEPDREVVVQDLSSQRVGALMRLINKDSKSFKVWDCCAASGGKSIMATDMLGGIDLTVTDIREQILVNLHKRFRQAGITAYHSFVSDLSGEGPLPRHEQNLLIADVPCTGSGTWGRTPEQLCFFREEKIGEYARLQRQIIHHASQRLAKGGYLLYITCSVFKMENEEMIDYLRKEEHYALKQVELIRGYEQRADTLFAALLQRS